MHASERASERTRNDRKQARKRASERTRNDRKQGPEASERTRNDRKQDPEASERANEECWWIPRLTTIKAILNDKQTRSMRSSKTIDDSGSQPFPTRGPLDEFCLGSRTTKNVYIFSGKFLNF